jgi:hypothetical protein
MLRAHRTPLVIVLLVASAPLRGAQTAADPSGHWEGTILIPNRQLPVTLDLARNPAGRWIGSISIPISTSIDVPLENVSVESSSVRFSAALPEQATFEAELSSDAQALSGTASNTQGGVRFELTRRGEAQVKIPPASSRLSPEFAGTWEGILQADGKSQRVRVKLAADESGTATGRLISVDHGNQEVPVTTVTIADKALQLESRPVSGTFRGTLGGDGVITGTWTQKAESLPLTLTRLPGAKP